MGYQAPPNRSGSALPAQVLSWGEAQSGRFFKVRKTCAHRWGTPPKGCIWRWTMPTNSVDHRLWQHSGRSPGLHTSRSTGGYLRWEPAEQPAPEVLEAVRRREPRGTVAGLESGHLWRTPRNRCCVICTCPVTGDLGQVRGAAHNPGKAECRAPGPPVGSAFGSPSIARFGGAGPQLMVEPW